MLNNLKDRLKINLAQKPVKPKRSILLLSNVTPDALLWRLHSDTASVGLSSDEGGQILNGRATEQLPLYNSLWDGGIVSVDRKGSEALF